MIESNHGGDSSIFMTEASKDKPNPWDIKQLDWDSLKKHLNLQRSQGLTLWEEGFFKNKISRSTLRE
ncbi:hypothetical protein GCM10023310_60520 [Paenibacillus vulneris]